MHGAARQQRLAVPLLEGSLLPLHDLRWRAAFCVAANLTVLSALHIFGPLGAVLQQKHVMLLDKKYAIL